MKLGGPARQIGLSIPGLLKSLLFSAQNASLQNRIVLYCSIISTESGLSMQPKPEVEFMYVQFLCLGIILRFLGLEVSLYNVYSYKPVSNYLCSRGKGLGRIKSVGRGD
jgi:hypothetical protein